NCPRFRDSLAKGTPTAIFGPSVTPGITNPMTTETFKIHGMDCADEIAVLRREVGPLVGGEEHLSFDLLNGRMTVTSEVDPATAGDAVRRVGMTAVPADDKSTATGDAADRIRRRLRLLTIGSGVATLLGLLLHAALGGGVWAAIGSEGA